MEKINKHTIESIKVYDKTVDSSYEYREEKKNFLSKNSPAGFYAVNTGWRWDENKLPGNKKVIGKTVYNKPYVLITLPSGNEIKMVKDTHKQAEKFAYDYIKKHELKGFINIWTV